MHSKREPTHRRVVGKSKKVKYVKGKKGKKVQKVQKGYGWFEKVQKILNVQKGKRYKNKLINQKKKGNMEKWKTNVGTYLKKINMLCHDICLGKYLTIFRAKHMSGYTTK